MDKLWAPWRINYIRSDTKQRGCLFCRIKKTPASLRQQEKRDKKNLVIFRSRLCFVTINLFPYNNGHLMVSPYRHIKDIFDLNSEETSDLIKTLGAMKKILDKALRPQGYNIGMNIGKIAGSGIAGHLHIHIVPRWQGDINFMPVTGYTKVISQSLQELYKILRREALR